MEVLLRCHVGPGMFSGEVAVRGTSVDGSEFSLFVPDDFVETERAAFGDDTGNGWLRVDVLAREGELMLVRLPGQTFENGRTITVRDSEIENRPHREAV